MMRLTMTLLGWLAILASLLPKSVWSAPDGAPFCTTGESAPGEPHRGDHTEGTLEEGGIVVTIGGQELVEDETLDIVVGMEYNVSITTTGFFRGVLAILGGGDALNETVGAFTVLDGDEDLKIMSDCEANGLAGVTHTINSNKTEVMFTLMVEEPSENMPLDVNIVQQTRPESIFFYTRYVLNAFSAPTEIPTSSPTTVPTETPTTVPTTAPTLTMMPTGTPSMMPSGAPTDLRTIYDYMTGNNLTIATLIEAANLVSTLDAEGANLTVLMPQESAFASLPPRIVQYLLDDVAVLSFTLLGHVLEGIFPSSTVATLDGETVSFIEGQQVISVRDGNIYVSVLGNPALGEAVVTNADIPASNGIIHEIDRILRIPTMNEVVAAASSAAVQRMVSTSGVDFATLQGVTLFSPTVAGFLTLAADHEDLAAEVLTNPSLRLHLQGMLEVHVFPDVAFSSDLVDEQVLTMSNGDEITVSIDNTTGVISLAPGSGPGGVVNVMPPNDLYTTGGVVHTVDAVLVPTFLTRSVADVAAAATTTLAGLLETADLKNTLDITFGVTVFAPVNSAFDKLDDNTLSFLQTPDGKETLVRILRYHVVTQVIPAADVTTGFVVTSEGGEIDIDVSAAGVVTINGASTVLDTDILAKNGIVHTIDTVLLPSDDTVAPTKAPTPAGAESTDPPTSSANRMMGWLSMFVAVAAIWSVV